jgi:hypothetical protein
VAALVPVYANSSLDSDLNTLISWPAGIAEIATAVWLAVMGVRVTAPLAARPGSSTTPNTAATAA